MKLAALVDETPATESFLVHARREAEHRFVRDADPKSRDRFLVLLALEASDREGLDTRDMIAGARKTLGASTWRRDPVRDLGALGTLLSMVTCEDYIVIAEPQLPDRAKAEAALLPALAGSLALWLTRSIACAHLAIIPTATDAERVQLAIAKRVRRALSDADLCPRAADPHARRREARAAFAKHAPAIVRLACIALGVPRRRAENMHRT